MLHQGTRAACFFLELFESAVEGTIDSIISLYQLDRLGLDSFGAVSECPAECDSLHPPLRVALRLYRLLPASSHDMFTCSRNFHLGLEYSTELAWSPGHQVGGQMGRFL